MFEACHFWFVHDEWAGSRPRCGQGIKIKVSTFYVTRVTGPCMRVRITFQTTGPLPPALGASSTSSMLLDLTGTARPLA